MFNPTRKLPISHEPPVIPVGVDAYLMWDRWAQLRIGARAYMRSTHDRSGANEGACAGHFLYQAADDFNVSMHVEGPGVLYFVRTNCWHGSPWHYETDGQDHVVCETATADPQGMLQHRHDEQPPPCCFEPEELFHPPLAFTWTTTRGADLNWVPIAFERSFRMAYGRTCYGTGYYIYHRYLPGAALSKPIRTFDWKTPPASEVEALLDQAGTDIAPRPGTPEGEQVGIRETHGSLSMQPGRWASLERLKHGPATLRALELSAPKARAVDLGAAWIRITWDDRDEPSVEAPLALFFGAGHLHNADQREYLVKGLPMHIRFDESRVHLACYYPMPFFQSAKVELIARSGTPIDDVRWSMRWAPYEGPANHVGYFHATYRDHPCPTQGEDLVLLDTRLAEGGGDWTGHFVGTSFIFSHRAYLPTLEAIPRFFFDDSLTPQGYGTGTEEWGGGGDYWGGRNMTLPLAGHPTGKGKPEDANHPLELVNSAYRFLLGDLMPFGRNALIRLEHGGENETREHYETVTYWYGLPGASLVPSDQLDIGDPKSEQAHDYRSDDASEPVTIDSRYEWGVDHLDGREIFPAHQEMERHTKGESSFTLRLAPNAFGALLRRTMDYAHPNQRAEVFVAPAGEDGSRTGE
jgi:D-arabinan exo alpha-(1,3)/(1,5)-arabinofuranosidase (non-reducing end)